MLPMNDLQNLRDREREIRHRAETERRVRAARDRDGTTDVDAELRLLIERIDLEEAHVSCGECGKELTRAAG